MPLLELKLPADAAPLPREVRDFLREADRRIDEFRQERRLTSFVPSDYPLVYRALRGLTAANLATGSVFCEWGSGFGVAACLAAMLGYEAYGIEVDAEMVKEAEQLAADFDLSVTYIRDSFIPRGSEACLDVDEPTAWMTLQVGTVEEEWGLGPGDFDLIFAYPWPDEEDVLGALFEKNAAAGATLLTYHGRDEMRLRRKTRRRKSSTRR